MKLTRAPSAPARVLFCCLMIVEAMPWTTVNYSTTPGSRPPTSKAASSVQSQKQQRQHSGRGFPPLQSTRAPENTASDVSSSPDDGINDICSSDGDVIVLADDPDFVKPDRDARKYRVIKLKENNLKVLLVSDQMAQGAVGTEAAAVHVQAGHFDDTIPGLAHFHEHMLFLGTEKYPKENDYENYLSQYGGGSSNAYTDMEDTNYYFSITTPNEDPTKTSEGLTGALDRLAQFFIKPNFDPDAVDRETNAIDSEYVNGKTSDSWRNYQALKSFANQDHPFGKFGCGNLETLTAKGKPKLLEELQNFWDTYYQSYNLRLSVVGHASLDALQKTVQETFGAVPFSEGIPRYEQAIQANLEKKQKTTNAKSSDLIFTREGAVYGSIAFGPEQLGMIRSIVPLLEARSIKVHFAVPPLDDPELRDSKPYRVLSHLLGHESPGSLHALLNEEGYLTGLSSGIGIDSSDFSLFSITMSLTPKGMANKDKVLDLLFQWVALIRDTGPDQLRLYHEELRQMSTINFRFRENGNPTDFCSNAAQALFDEYQDPKLLLSGTSMTSQFDPKVVEAFLLRMIPDNALIVVTNSDLKEELQSAELSEKGWSVEPYYGAPHKQEVMSENQIQIWQSPPDFDRRLHIPELNAYIPDDFSLRCEENSSSAPQEDAADRSVISVPPVPIVDSDKMRLWHKMDTYWRVPKAFIRLSIMTPDVYASPKSMTYNRIFQRILNDDLNSFVYDASLAGCNYRVSCTPTGYRISVSGYSQKLSFLLDTLTARMFSLIEELKAGDAALKDKFDQARDGLCRETKNYRLDSPYEVANYNSRLLLEESVWYIDNYIDLMEGESAEKQPLTMAECAEAAEDSISKRIKCEALCMGNIAPHEARTVGDMVSERFLASSSVLSDVETPSFRSLKLPTREEAMGIFGPVTSDRSIPLIYADMAYSSSEENSAVELILQVGSELEMGYRGLAIFDLITHIAYNSAYNRLRTNEQLGYIVSVVPRKTAGNAWSMTVIVQSSVATPDQLEERMEAWLESFRDELINMTPAEYASEANAVAAQLLETDTKLSQEVSTFWGEILNTEGMTANLRTPAFDRLQKLSEELSVEEMDGEEDESNESDSPSKSSDVTGAILKDRVLSFFDKYFTASSPNRRAMSSRLYSQRFKKEFEDIREQPGVVSKFSDIKHLKQYLSSWPTAPYWRIDNSTVTSAGPFR
mmetsp:Transcript_4229/g.8839  ORF Transcript_4229/g.8839 Transcript_4229/m.8839 type:complete len:1203 (+) Transcript_4229:238-3846(+)